MRSAGTLTLWTGSRVAQEQRQPGSRLVTLRQGHTHSGGFGAEGAAASLELAHSFQAAPPGNRREKSKPKSITGS